MNNNKDNYQLIGIIGAVLMVIGVFLPFAKLTLSIISKDVPLFDVEGDGMIVLVLSIVTLVIILFNIKNNA